MKIKQCKDERINYPLIYRLKESGLFERTTEALARKSSKRSREDMYRRKPVYIRSIESLILAQDERWRRA